MTPDSFDVGDPSPKRIRRRLDRDISTWTVVAVAAAWLVSAACILLWLTPPGGLIPVWIGLPVVVGTVAATWYINVRLPLREFAADHVGAVSGVAWALGTFLALLSYPIVGFPLFDLVAYGLIALAGLVALVLAVATIRRRAQSIIGVSAILATCLAVLLAFNPILFAGIAMRTWMLESRYENDLTAIRVEGPGAVENYPTIYVDAGPPQRVFWPWWFGVLDNVGGVLHDPSRTAERARAALSNEPAMISICTHLYDDWYYCAFD